MNLYLPEHTGQMPLTHTRIFFLLLLILCCHVNKHQEKEEKKAKYVKDKKQNYLPFPKRTKAIGIFIFVPEVKYLLYLLLMYSDNFIK